MYMYPLAYMCSACVSFYCTGYAGFFSRSRWYRTFTFVTVFIFHLVHEIAFMFKLHYFYVDVNAHAREREQFMRYVGEL